MSSDYKRGFQVIAVLFSLILLYPVSAQPGDYQSENDFDRGPRENSRGDFGPDSVVSKRISREFRPGDDPSERGDVRERDLEDLRGEYSQDYDDSPEEYGEDYGESYDDSQELRQAEFEKRMGESDSNEDLYQHEVSSRFDSSYTTPSFDGYSDDHMVYARIFSHLDENFNPEEIMQHCNDPEKMADIVLAKVSGKLKNFEQLCGQESNCEEKAKNHCERLGSFAIKGATKLEILRAKAQGCPPDKDAIVSACKVRSTQYLEKKLVGVEQNCQKRFDKEGARIVAECDKFKSKMTCDKDAFMKRCVGGITRDDFNACPKVPEEAYKTCPKGQREKKDSNGCFIGYECIDDGCPPVIKIGCDEGYTPHTKKDSAGCEYVECAPNSIPEPTCPPVIKTECGEGYTQKTKTDSTGCEYVECAPNSIPEPTCPPVIKTECGEGYTLHTKKDSVGCEYVECVETHGSESSIPTITGNTIRDELGSYENLVSQCEKSWQKQQDICTKTPPDCNKGSLVSSCVELEKKNYDEMLKKITVQCAQDTIPEMKTAEKRCAKIIQEKENCLTMAQKRCRKVAQTMDTCKEKVTEENLRKFIILEASKRCRFIGIENDEKSGRDGKSEVVYAVLNTATEKDFEKINEIVEESKVQLELEDTTVYKGVIDAEELGDLKLLSFVTNVKLFSGSSRSKEVKTGLVSGKQVAAKLASLRESGVSNEFLYLIEDEASEVLDASESVAEVEENEEQKGFAYKFKRYLGLAKEAEEQEIAKLSESRQKLEKSIESLAKLQEEVPDDLAKAVLKEQLESLEQQKKDIEGLIVEKEKKAKGLFSIFG